MLDTMPIIHGERQRKAGKNGSTLPTTMALDDGEPHGTPHNRVFYLW